MASLQRLSTFWDVEPYQIADITPDERLLAVDSNGNSLTCETQVVEIATGKVLHRVRGLCIGFRNNGQYLLTGYSIPDEEREAGKSPWREQLTDVETGHVLPIDSILLMIDETADRKKFDQSEEEVIIEAHQLLIKEDWRNDYVQIVDLVTKEIRLELPCQIHQILSPDQTLLAVNDAEENRFRVVEIPSCIIRFDVRDKQAEWFLRGNQWLELTDHEHDGLRYVMNTLTGEIQAVGKHSLVGKRYFFATTGFSLDIYGNPQDRIDAMPPARPLNGLGRVLADNSLIRQKPNSDLLAEIIPPPPNYLQINIVKGDPCLVLGRYHEWLYIAHYKREVVFLDAEIFITIGWILAEALEEIESWEHVPMLEPESPQESLKRAAFAS